MSNLHKTLSYLCEKKGITAYKMCKDLNIQPSVMTDLKKGRRSSVRAETAQKLADYFGVSVSYLLNGEETKKAPIQTDERCIDDDDIKFALFGGDCDITDEMYDEVKRFAKMVRLREEAEKRGVQDGNR